MSGAMATCAITKTGGFIILGRSDAVLNPGGVRIGTAEIYRQVEKLDEVLESVAVGQDWEDDVRVVLFVRLREGASWTGAARYDSQHDPANTTPRHVPAKIIQVRTFPGPSAAKSSNSRCAMSSTDAR